MPPYWPSPNYQTDSQSLKISVSRSWNLSDLNCWSWKTQLPQTPPELAMDPEYRQELMRAADVSATKKMRSAKKSYDAKVAKAPAGVRTLGRSPKGFATGS